MQKRSLQLDQDKSNPLFDNWKLARGLIVSDEVVTLDGHVTVLDHNTDYLNTRSAVLHNHLNGHNERFFVFHLNNQISSLCELRIDQHAILKTVWGRSSYQVFRCA